MLNMYLSVTDCLLFDIYICNSTIKLHCFLTSDFELRKKVQVFRYLILLKLKGLNKRVNH